jgi:hypothetical protein
MSGSGVWVFKNGAVRLPEQPSGCERERKILVHKLSGEVMCSYKVLEVKLLELGWERYYMDPDLFQFRKHCSVDLISLPKDFHKLNSIHMYDIVHKNSNAFPHRRPCYRPRFFFSMAFFSRW